ncbi:Furcatin hydrolase [Sesamum angolense]|uniref:Furcatin hydrolase n=1 Tax=Sesamum angolense TaxID=2727404 RepID=A0AAE1VZ35_9LAMI|nr:Furcatin hydrolase [Sesamum angolense]
MSISWPRILPRGKLSGGVNKRGIAFYNNVFNELLANGITPFVTLFHWDLPQTLEDEYKGFLSPNIIDDFRDFAELCFKEFGDRVKHWITLNEPFSFASGGYDGSFVGRLAPGRCSLGTSVLKGTQQLSLTLLLITCSFPMRQLSNYIRRNIRALEMLKDFFVTANSKGEIGISLVAHWMEPYSSNKLDVQAAERALDFMYGWFLHPLVYGDYPRTMQSLVGNRLPNSLRSKVQW